MNDDDYDFYDDEDEIELVSKTRMKKEMHALQDLGEALTKLPPEQLATIPLEPVLQQAIEQTQRIKKREALRRQLQYIGKLMRKSDYEEIEEAYNKLRDQHDNTTRQLHIIEGWRDRLIEDGNDEMEAFFNAFPQADRQQIRHLVKAAKVEKLKNKPPTSARKLFKMIRDEISHASEH